MRIIVAACLLIAAAASAQTPAAVPPPSSASGGWVSLGLGNVMAPDLSGGDAHVGITAFSGHLLMAGRLGGSLAYAKKANYDKDETSLGSQTAMVGVRTLNPNAFATAAIGVGSAWSKRRINSCAASCADSTIDTPASRGVALVSSVHTSFLNFGLGAEVFAMTRTSHTNFLAISLSAELGFFGR
jgi:hypothetical protein